MLLGSLFAFLLSGCGSVPDRPWCTDLRPDAGFCVWSISNKEQVVDDNNLLITEEHPEGQTWYDMQVGIIKAPMETFVAFKKYIIQQCKRNGNCKETIDSWDRAMTTLEDRAKAVAK